MVGLVLCVRLESLRIVQEVPHAPIAQPIQIRQKIAMTSAIAHAIKATQDPTAALAQLAKSEHIKTQPEAMLAHRVSQKLKVPCNQAAQALMIVFAKQGLAQVEHHVATELS